MKKNVFRWHFAEGFSQFSRRCLTEPAQKKYGGWRCAGPRLHDVSSMGHGPELGTMNKRERERESQKGRKRGNKNKYEPEYTIWLNDSAELHLPYDAAYGSAADVPAPTCHSRAVRVCAAARTVNKCKTKKEQY